MNDDNVATTQDAERPSSPADSDWLLQYWVTKANRGFTTTGVTLTMGGLVISGLLVGGREWFEGMAEEMHTAQYNAIEPTPQERSNETRAALVKEFKEIAEVYPPSPTRFATMRDYEEALKAIGWKPEKRPTYIHLKDAHIYSPGHASGHDHPIVLRWWRGKIAAVDGFAFSKLERD